MFVFVLLFFGGQVVGKSDGQMGVEKGGGQVVP